MNYTDANAENIRLFLDTVSSLCENPKVRSMSEILQHGDTSCLLHSLAVAYYSLRIVTRFGIACDKRSLIRGALLHDYFLYDWHVKPHPKHHATKHGVYAAINALKDFGLNAVERNAIESHMWPVCLFTLPLFRESWIVQLADKRVTWKEFLARFAKKKAA